MDFIILDKKQLMPYCNFEFPHLSVDLTSGARHVKERIDAQGRFLLSACPEIKNNLIQNVLVSICT